MSPIPDYQAYGDSQLDDLRFVISAAPSTINDSIFATPKTLGEQNDDLDNAVLLTSSSVTESSSV